MTARISLLVFDAYNRMYHDTITRFHMDYFRQKITANVLTQF
jgi:hypothetical protein